MSETSNTDNSIRFSQVLAGALAAVTAAVLGSTMGVAGTVVGAGLASIITTVGGALYMRSIQRTRQGVRTVRDIVVARAGTTSVTLVEESSQAGAVAGERAGEDAAAEGAAADLAEGTDLETRTEIVEPGGDQPPAGHKLHWPALIAASVLSFVLGLMMITGVEWVRGEPLSGGDGTSVGGIVRTDSGGGDNRDDAPPATPESTTPQTGTVTVTPAPPASEDGAPTEPPAESNEPGTTGPETTTGEAPTGTVSVPPTGQSG